MDTNGFETTLTSHYQSLLRYACRLTGDEDEARDLVQDTCEKALLNRSTYVDLNFEGWVFAILHNTFLKMVRSKKVRRAERFEDVENQIQDKGIAGNQYDTVALKEVLAAFRELPPEKQKMLCIGVSYDTYGSVAKAMGVAPITVRTRICRARRMLRENLEARAAV